MNICDVLNYLPCIEEWSVNRVANQITAFATLYHSMFVLNQNRPMYWNSTIMIPRCQAERVKTLGVCL